MSNYPDGFGSKPEDTQDPRSPWYDGPDEDNPQEQNDASK